MAPRPLRPGRRSRRCGPRATEIAVAFCAADGRLLRGGVQATIAEAPPGSPPASGASRGDPESGLAPGSRHQSRLSVDPDHRGPRPRAASAAGCRRPLASTTSMNSSHWRARMQTSSPSSPTLADDVRPDHQRPPSPLRERCPREDFVGVDPKQVLRWRHGTEPCGGAMHSLIRWRPASPAGWNSCWASTSST